MNGPSGPVTAEPEPVLGSAVPAGVVPVGARAWVVTVSDRAHQGTYPDRSGPVLADGLRALGFGVTGPILVPDEADQVVAALAEAVEHGVELAVTTGGTGLAPRDVTPEATRRLLDREVPGLAEALRAYGVAKVPTAMLSRGLAGVAGSTLVVNLPGSTGGVRDGLAVLGSVVAHAINQIRGDADGHDQSADSGLRPVHSGSQPVHGGPQPVHRGH